MKVTRLGGTRPLVTIGSIIGGGSTAGATESPAPSGHVPTSNGSNGVSWGSNVATITVNGTTLVQGPFVDFSAGSNTTVSAASNTIRIHATASGVSFGSNANSVGTANAGGASTDASRADHVHMLTAYTLGRWEVVVSGTAPPVAVSTPADDDWVYGWVAD